MSTATPYVRKLVAIASAEFDAFHEIQESDEPLRSRIDAYCDAIGIARPDAIEDFPWSATFISWCVKTAGATAAEFRFSAAHAVFVKAAIANADAGTGVFRARPVDAYKPKIGDLIHRNRNGGRVTYKQARSRSDYESHSAIVMDLIETQGSKFAITIGGNEGNSIRRQRVRLTPDGFVQQVTSNPYISIVEDLKVQAGTIESLFEPASDYESTDDTGPEHQACEAGGEPAQMELEVVPEKPPARQETTTHKNSREGTRIDHIVIHYTTSRNIEGTISHFKTGTPRTSAHYIVGRDGALVQMVPDRERAWHAGNSGMNARSIGIEHVARLGDRITTAQSATSIALIRFLMHTHAIPASNIIPHVCVKPTDCCGDLFGEFGGAAGASCAQQTAALRRWLAANGIGTEPESVISSQNAADPGKVWIVTEAATASQRTAMAKHIVDFEARRDAQGRIAVHELRPEDGGGRYEVAGINERYHRQECDELVALIRAGRHAEAERRAAEFIANYTDKAANWTGNVGIEFYLRDSMFNRGPGGAAWILQKAVDVPTDREVGPITLAAVRAAEARPLALLDSLRAAREAYERLRRDETSIFWRGLVNRWNKARAYALSLMEGSAAVLDQTAGPAARYQFDAAAEPFRLRRPGDAEAQGRPLVHIIREGVRCDTDTRGHATPHGRSPLEIVVNAPGGFVPLWAPDTMLRWQFGESSFQAFEDPQAAKTAVERLFAAAVLEWGSAAPVKFTKRSDAWDFEIVMRQNDDCDINGCVLASAFFPDAGRHELVLYPKIFEQNGREQVETLIHEIGHIFGLRHFFAQVSETAWPSEIFGTHQRFSIMNYGEDSRLTNEDKADLRKLYQLVWAGKLTHINGTPIKLVKPYHTTGAVVESFAGAKQIQAACEYHQSKGA